MDAWHARRHRGAFLLTGSGTVGRGSRNARRSFGRFLMVLAGIVLVPGNVLAAQWAQAFAAPGAEVFADKAAFVAATAPNRVATFEDVPARQSSPFASGDVYFPRSMQAIDDPLGANLPYAYWFGSSGSPQRFASFSGSASGSPDDSALGGVFVFPGDVSATGFDFTCFACDTLPDDSELAWEAYAANGGVVASGTTVVDLHRDEGSDPQPHRFFGLVLDRPFRSLAVSRRSVSRPGFSGNWFLDDLRYVPEPPSLARAGRYGYAASGPWLAVIDAANPAIVARIPLGAAANGALAASPAGTAVYVATTDRIAVVDPRSRTVVATVSVGHADMLLTDSAGAYLYAAGRLSLAGAAPENTVSVVDARTNTMTAAAPLPSSAFPPSGMVAHPDGTRLYVRNTFSGGREDSVSVIDTALWRVVADIPLSGEGLLAADPMGRFVYAAVREGLAVIDTAIDAITATIAIPTEPYGTVVTPAIAFDPEGTLAWVAAYVPAFFGGHDGRVLAIDTATQGIVATVALDQLPKALVVDPAGERVYVSGQVTASPARPTQLVPAGVDVIDAATRTVVATIPPVSPAPYVVSPGSLVLNAATAAVWAMDSSGVYAIDAATGAIAATLPPTGALAFAPDLAQPPARQWHYLLGSRTSAFSALPWGAPGDAAVTADYDGDGRADVAVFRPREGGEEGIWWVRRTADGGITRRQWGAASLADVPVPADYDGDGRSDFAVWRPALGEWYILRSTDGGTSYWRFGHSAELPVPADYDGDGRADLATYAAGTWQVFGSTIGNTTLQLGAGVDMPVPGDYDGDGRADAAVFGPTTGVWLILESGASTVSTAQWGMPGDVPVPADYDGDGTTDVAVWRPASGTWWIRSSRSGEVLSVTWGAAGDRPEPADFDGDRKADQSVYRP